MNSKNNWHNSNIQIFWKDIVPFDHLVQVYENDRCFLDTLEGFAGTGILAGDCIIMIASESHLRQLDHRLRNQGFDMDRLREEKLYIPADANVMLSQFMVNGMPDEKLFNNCMYSLWAKAVKHHGKRVRTFGEMVALLVEQGLPDACIRLEHLWNRFKRNNATPFTLFCAYRQADVMAYGVDVLRNIYSLHTVIIDGTCHPSTEIYYRKVS